MTFIDLSNKVKGLIVIGIYSHPKVSAKCLARQMSNAVGKLAEKHTYFIIGGDFNCDATEKLAEPLDQFCENFGLRQIVNEVTTDNNTKIDLIFTNVKVEN